MKQAFWISAAAVLEKDGTLPDQLLQRWHDCIQESNDPQIIRKILSAAFPDICSLPLHELCNVSGTLVEKSLKSSQEDIILGQRTDLLEPMRLPLITRPGLLLFAGETIKLWLASHNHQQHAYLTAVQILLWLAETADAENESNSQAFISFVNLLAQQQNQLPPNHHPLPPPHQQESSILATVLRHFHTFPLGTKLQAMKLIGLCCQNSDFSSTPSVFFACWPNLEHILCSERNEEVLHITACALFESISSHAANASFTSSNTTKHQQHQQHQQQQSPQLGATAALENGLACPMPCIQFPAAVAAGKILLQQRQYMLQHWKDEYVTRVATAADQSYRIQLDRVAAWGAWQPGSGVEGEGAATAAQAQRQPLLHVSSSRKLTAQHVLAALEIVHKEQYPMNRET